MVLPTSFDPVAIRVDGLGKCYQIYQRPQDRLKQSIVPRLRRLLGQRATDYYREFWALRDVSFEIMKGDTVGIIGRNGSGKSTLLQMICGTLTPTTGAVETTGRVAALLELGAGFNPEFTGRENVLLNGAILGLSRQEMQARMESVLEFSELGPFLDQPVKTYSSGMYARLAFATAIHVDPEILIVDETLSVGDARFVAKCMRRIGDMRNQGVTILFVSHDVTSIRTLCDHAVWIDGGSVVDKGDVFPVSGRYMEFMFRDDSCPVLPAPEVGKRRACSGGDGNPAGTSDNAAGGAAAATGKVGAKPGDSSGPHLDSRPVIHWGSHRGLILSASVSDISGARQDVHHWAAEMEVTIDLRVSADIPRDHLSVAFSIKDLKGTDLIVSTTRDTEQRRLPECECFRVTFRFVNPLVTGKYLLVAAVENRQHLDVHYYEYLEGAHYFSSVSDWRFFGVFQPLIEQRIAVA
jgi:lipopolysaccharide transport system ATP-binding protein